MGYAAGNEDVFSRSRGADRFGVGTTTPPRPNERLSSRASTIHRNSGQQSAFQQPGKPRETAKIVDVLVESADKLLVCGGDFVSHLAFRSFRLERQLGGESESPEIVQLGTDRFSQESFGVVLRKLKEMHCLSTSNLAYC